MVCLVRPALAHIAVRLWREWRAGAQEAGDRLLRYNESDTRNLESLAALIFDRMTDRYGPASLHVG